MRVVLRIVRAVGHEIMGMFGIVSRGDAPMRIGKGRIGGRHLVMRGAHMHPPEIMCDFLRPDRAIAFWIAGGLRRGLDRARIAKSRFPPGVRPLHQIRSA